MSKKNPTTNPLPAGWPEGTPVGVTPYGETWTAWREPWRTDAEHAEKVATMHEALADAWKRHAARKVA